MHGTEKKWASHSLASCLVHQPPWSPMLPVLLPCYAVLVMWGVPLLPLSNACLRACTPQGWTQATHGVESQYTTRLLCPHNLSV